METAAPGSPPAGAGRLDDGQLEILRFLVRHGMASTPQLAWRFSTTPAGARRRLRPLEDARLVTSDRVIVGFPALVRATPRGARLSGCDLPPASLELGRIRHSLALVDLCAELVDAHPASSWTTERELRRDRMRAARNGPRPDRQRRVPDGLLRTPDGRRVAVELDLTPKRSSRLQLLAGAYAVDPDVDVVWWYLPSHTAAARMAELVADRGLGELIEPRVRRLTPPVRSRR